MAGWGYEFCLLVLKVSITSERTKVLTSTHGIMSPQD